MWLQKNFTAIIAIFAFVLAECIIQPIGEFPLNDDWAYALPVNHFLQTNEIHFSFWQAIPGLTQFFAGISISKIFGFSFTALRFTSIICVPILIFLLDVFLRNEVASKSFRLFLILLFVLNPLTIYLANTYLPDMLQLLLSFMSFIFFTRYLKKQDSFNYAAFGIFCVLATLNRQTGLLLPLSTFIVLIPSAKSSVKKIFFSVLPFSLALMALLIFEELARTRQILPANYGLQLNSIFWQLAHPSFLLVEKFSYYLVNLFLALGLFVSPIIIGALPQCARLITKNKINFILFLFFILAVTAKIFFSGKFIPFSGNIFSPGGIGPVIMTGYNTDEAFELSFLQKTICCVLSFAGAFSFLSFCLLLAEKRKEMSAERKLILNFCTVFALLYVLPLCVNYMNDRYLLLLLPFLVIVASFLEIKLYLKPAWLILIVGGIMSIAANHDYMALNKSRHIAINNLLQNEKIPAEKIDGGFEFNAWHFSETRPYEATHKGRWWWVKDEEFIISPAKIPGMHLHSQYSFASFLSMSKKNIYVWKRE